MYGPLPETDTMVHILAELRPSGEICFRRESRFSNEEHLALTTVGITTIR